MKILSVDDDPEFLDFIKLELSALGCTNVVQASSAEQAQKLVKAAKDPFDLFLLDIDMPEIDGVQLCSMLRREPTAASVPIVMVTVRAELESVDRAFEAGATDYLSKPLSRRELRGRVQMAERLALERATLKHASSNGGATVVTNVGDPILLEGVPGCIDYLAMQNYMLKLNSIQAFTHVAQGVCVTNVDDIFLTKDSMSFRDAILDVAEILSESLGSGTRLISYLGSGEFVFLVNRVSGWDQDAFMDVLTIKLSDLGNLYRTAGEIIPRLRLGEPTVRKLFSMLTPDELLVQAIENARDEGTDLVFRPDFDTPDNGEVREAM